MDPETLNTFSFGDPYGYNPAWSPIGDSIAFVTYGEVNHSFVIAFIIAA